MVVLVVWLFGCLRVWLVVSLAVWPFGRLVVWLLDRLLARVCAFDWLFAFSFVLCFLSFCLFG